MVRIIYEPTEYCLTVKGHAGYAEPGEDIVCAAVSALTDTLLRQVKKRVQWQPAYGVNRETATVRVRLSPRSGRAGESARLVLDTIFGGYEIIAEQYPAWVRTEVR